MNTLFEEFKKIKFMELPDAYVSAVSQDDKLDLQNKVLALLQDAKGDLKKLPEGLIMKISFFPEVVEEIMLALPEDSSAISSLALANPASAFYVLKSHYNTPLGMHLEVLLMSQPEIILELFEWSVANKQRLHYSKDVYLPAIYQDISATWRYLHTFLPNAESEIFRILTEAYRTYGTELTAQSALLQYIFKDNQNDALRTIVCQHPKTAIIYSALKKKDMGLNRWATYPKWAYHIMHYANEFISPTLKTVCIEALVRQLPWIYQYLTECDMQTKNPQTYRDYMSVASSKWHSLGDI